MRNPIHNAVVEISKRDIVSCKRCGCPDLTWVTYKSGKHGLVQVAYNRPLWRGDGPAPVGLYALKFNYHNCAEYLAGKADAERRTSQCHPKADKPREILADAMSVIIQMEAPSNYAQFVAGKGPNFEAMEILMQAQSQIEVR